MLSARIAVLVSGGGTNLQALLDARAEGRLQSGSIVLVEEKKAINLIKNSNAKTLNLSLKELVNFISSCDLVIGNDSGVTHIAWAQNRPSITLFGNRPASRNAYTTPVNLTLDAGKKIDAKKISQM